MHQGEVGWGLKWLLVLDMLEIQMCTVERERDEQRSGAVEVGGTLGKSRCYIFCASVLWGALRIQWARKKTKPAAVVGRSQYKCVQVCICECSPLPSPRVAPVTGHHSPVISVDLFCCQGLI